MVRGALEELVAPLVLIGSAGPLVLDSSDRRESDTGSGNS